MHRHLAATLIAAAIIPANAFAQCPDGTPPPCRGAPRPASSVSNTSIAVLYFDNLSRDTNDVYLADGFTEEVMSRLGQVEGLQIKSRTAVQRLRGRTDTDPLVAGRSLGVAHLVSGSVLKQRGRVRVTVELTRVTTGNRTWGGSFDRPADDLIGTEAEIAESVAVNVGARLAPAEVRRIEARPTRNGTAYDHYLRGKFETTRRSTAGYLAAIRQFEAALRLDSMLTPARLLLASSNSLLASLYWSPGVGIPRDSLLARASRERDRALRQDSTSVEALMARTAGQDPERAMFWLRRALALAPRNADAHHSMGLNLRQLDRDSESIAEFRRALEIEPERPISLVNLGQTYLMMRQYSAAAPWIDSAIALRPEAAFYYKEGALLRLLRGDTAGARAMAPQLASHGSPDGREEILAMLEARAGDSAAARSRVARVDSAWASRECFVSHECLELAMALAAAGSRDRALAVLERVTPPGSWLNYWIRRPEFDVIRDDPRFSRIVAASRAAMRSGGSN